MIMKKFLAMVLVLILTLGSAAMAENLGDLLGDVVSAGDYSGAEHSGEWWNILLLGTDNRYEVKGYSRTDSMIVLSVNLGTKQAKLTSFMRDTWVNIDGHGNAKLNAASVYGGPALTMKTIGDNFGVEIDNYALINITGLAEVIDTLGGLDMSVTEAERKALNKGLFDLSSQSGMEKLEASGDNVHLNGNQAVAFARIRKIDSDYKRTERQRYVLTVMAEKLKQTNDAATIVGVVNALLPYVETDLGLGDLMSLAYVGLQMDTSAIQQLRLPADGTYDAGTFDGVWCIKPNMEKNRSILKEFIYGE